jgi:hypothetical protein
VRSPLTVDKKELVTLPVLLWLVDAHEEAEAALVEEALLQSLKEKLPLTDGVAEFAKLTVGETEEDEKAVLLPLAAAEKEAEVDEEDDTLNEASWVLVLVMEGEVVYEGAVDIDGEAVSADVGETAPEELATPDGVLE